MGQVVADASMSLDGYIAKQRSILCRQLPEEGATLDDPITCVQGDRVTHLVFPLAESSPQSLEG